MRIVGCVTVARRAAQVALPDVSAWAGLRCKVLVSEGASGLIAGGLLRRGFSLSSRPVEALEYPEEFRPRAPTEAEKEAEAQKLKRVPLAGHSVPELIEFLDMPFDPDFEVTLIPEFITEEEADALEKVANRLLARRRYEKGHWDQVIKGYREAQHTFRPRGGAGSATSKRAQLEQAAAEVGQRLRDLVPHPQFPIHFLDLEEEGVIEAHVDNVSFCGNAIAGVSLLSPSVMTLTRDDGGPGAVRLMLHPRTLYILHGASRYEWAHAVGVEPQEFRGEPVTRSRRLSVMARSEVLERLK